MKAFCGNSKRYCRLKEGLSSIVEIMVIIFWGGIVYVSCSMMQLETIPGGSTRIVFRKAYIYMRSLNKISYLTTRLYHIIVIKYSGTYNILPTDLRIS